MTVPTKVLGFCSLGGWTTTIRGNGVSNAMVRRDDEAPGSCVLLGGRDCQKPRRIDCE